MKPAVHSSGSGEVMRGAYCFRLSFTPTSVIANSIAHPDDTPFGPLFYTAGPNVKRVAGSNNYELFERRNHADSSRNSTIACGAVRSA